MITNALDELETSITTADAQIQTLNQKLQKFEQAVPTELDQEQETVLELLDSVTEVKAEYENLRKELHEVQQLQKEMSNSLRYQLRTMHQTFNILKKKIEANPAQFSGALQNNHQPHHHHHHNSNGKIH